MNNELTALKDLLDRNEISSVVYVTKSKALVSAEAALASVQQRVKLLEAGTRPEMVAEAQGLLEAAKADLEQAKLTLQWCSITSPIDGVVVQLLARQGQFFDRAVALATVMDLSEVFVQIRIPSSQFAKVHQGTRIEIELGVETSDRVQVVQGLSRGDSVATAGGYGLPEACPVQVVADTADSKDVGDALQK